MHRGSSPPPPERRASEAGLTVVEGVVAAALLLLIAIGVLPFFTRAMANNLQGNYMTQMNNAGVDQSERLLSLPFNNIDMSVPAGQTSFVTTAQFDHTTQQWSTTLPLPSGHRADMIRTVTIQQYKLQDLLDDGVADTPLDGTTPINEVNLKTIQIRAQNTRALSGASTVYVVYQTF
jgi:hypothetical protein